MSDGFTIEQNYTIRVAHAYGYEPNRARGLPAPAPYTPRVGSDEWQAAQLKPQPRPENQRPSLARKRDTDAPAKPRAPRKSRAKPAMEQAA